MSEEKVRAYKKGDLTVVWRPSLCIHSEKCFKGLPQVFDPNRRPWIDMDGSESEMIQKQVDLCPSGALSAKIRGQGDVDPSSPSPNEVEPIPNGPLMVYGELVLKNTDGTVAHKSKATAFCRCGASDNKPFCDGSHKNIGFVG
ncbi:MAG: (4Fe-4S)-binding protein [Cyclobacteriaceae bacterium]|nr:(4Fe-4S)-binding protein [Cyclobacteriaceae bacterium HetDA_MAG_MS6]